MVRRHFGKLHVIALALLTACSSDDAKEPAGERPTAQSVFAFRRGVQTTEEWQAYLHLTDKLDVPGDSLDDAEAREMQGDVFEASGALFVSEGGEVTKYQVNADRSWGATQKLSFADYPVGEDGANFYYMFRVDEQTMYLQLDAAKRVVWNPRDMEIIALKEDSAVPLELEGYPLIHGGNITDFQGDGPTIMTYFYADEDWFDFASKSYVALYDRKTHEETKVIEIPCPGISTVSRDEDGYTYLSTNNYSGLLHQYNPDKAEPCIARLTPDFELDSAFTTTLTDLTDGHYGSMFQYVRDGWGLMTVLLHEEIGVDPSKSDGSVPADVLEASFEFNHWQVWVVDLDKKVARPFEPLGEFRGFLDQGSINKIDGRWLLSVEYDDDEMARRTKVFELSDSADGELIDDFRGGGKWMKLR